MSDDDASPEVVLEYAPVLRTETGAVPFRRSLPILRRPRELNLSTVVLASGMALAVEGLRLAARSSRKRATLRPTNAPPEHVTMMYEWTQITYERYERS